MRRMAAMEPRIQYARYGRRRKHRLLGGGEGAAAGHSAGRGVYARAAGVADLEYRHWYERLAERCTVIRYDGRGCGLSERTSSDFSLDAQMRDLEAVRAFEVEWRENGA